MTLSPDLDSWVVSLPWAILVAILLLRPYLVRKESEMPKKKDPTPAAPAVGGNGIKLPIHTKPLVEELVRMVPELVVEQAMDNTGNPEPFLLLYRR